jgi:Tfp pilus assembly protein PilF
MNRHFFLKLSLAALGLIGLIGCSPAQPRSASTLAQKQQIAAHINLGRILLIQSDLAGALSELSKAEKIEPDNVEVLTYIGLAYYSRQDYQKALDYYKRTLALDPSRTEIHNNLGLVYMELQQYDLAKGEFEVCLNDVTYAKPWLPQFNLGAVEQIQGHLKEAEDIYLKLISVSPQYAPPYYRLGQLYYERGDTRQAWDDLLNAVRLDPSYADAFFLLAQGYEKLGQKDEAAEAYGQVVVLSPNTPRAIEAQRRVRKVLGFE